MSALLLLFICLAFGLAAARWAKPPPTLAQSLNWWVMNIALPALVLDLIPKLHFDPQLWFLPVAMWLVFGGAWLFFAILGPRLGWSRSRIGALILVAGLGNTAFMGYPMVEALRGEEGLGLAVIARRRQVSPWVGWRSRSTPYSSTSSPGMPGCTTSGAPPPAAAARRKIRFCGCACSAAGRTRCTRC